MKPKFLTLDDRNINKILLFLTAKETVLILYNVNHKLNSFIKSEVYHDLKRSEISTCLKEIKSVVKNISDLKHIISNHSENLEVALKDFSSKYNCFILYKSVIILPFVLLSNLITLDFNQLNIGYDGVILLSFLIQKTKSLTSLFLGYNNIGDDGCAFLVEPLSQNSTIVNLNLECNRISDEGFMILIDVIIKKQTLKNLKFSLNIMTNKSLTHFASKIQVNQFSILEFKYNNIITNVEDTELFRKVKILY